MELSSVDVDQALGDRADRSEMSPDKFLGLTVSSGGVCNGSGLSCNKEELVCEVGNFSNFGTGSDNSGGDDLAAE